MVPKVTHGAERVNKQKRLYACEPNIKSSKLAMYVTWCGPLKYKTR